MATYTGTSLSDIEGEAYADSHPSPSDGTRRPARCQEASSRCSPWHAPWRPAALLLLDELSMGLAPIVVEDLYAKVADIARGGISILVVEQFARTVLGVADLAAIMVQGRIKTIGSPEKIAEQLTSAYLGGPS